MSKIVNHLSTEVLREFGAMSRDAFELLLPPTDVFEDSSELVIMLDMPGFDKNNIKTRLSESTLTVSAKREPSERDGVSYWEQRLLRVNKRIQLPIRVSTQDNETKAIYENGVLVVRLPVKGTEKISIL
ncbi:MAG: Hsp20/alpha crystallin family protein [Thaumarchaeota archaeon]|nr:Hsp20/alpha crystallin family protein [Nitrososphaerota archaeon]